MLSTMKTFALIPAAIALLACAAPSFAQSGADYSNPISTDRPDFVDSSAVVGKGRVQIETSGAFERSRRDGVTERSATTPTLLRFGLNDALEFRVETDGATHSWTRGLDTQDASGMADTALGVKWHVRDGAEGVPALGLRVNVVMPSGARRLNDGGVRPSLRGVAEWDLPGDMNLGVMPGFTSERNDNGERFTSAMFGMALGKNWTPRLSSYVELAAPRIAHARDGGSQVAAGFGSAFLLTPDCQIDAGILGGLNRFTPNVSLTVGLSVRL